MYLEVDPQSATPIYMQIFAQVQGLIGRGELCAGGRVPSVRDLAVSLRVNRNTVARAYQMLEQEGLLETRTGQGSFVGESAPRWSTREARSHLRDSVERLAREAGRLGVSRQDVIDLINEQMGSGPLGGGNATRSSDS